MIYMDCAATSWPKPEAVYEAMDSFMRHRGVNPGRSGYRLSVEASGMVYAARGAVAEIFNVENPQRIIFTKNATEALNMATKGILRPGGHVITSGLEHNSVMRPLRALEAEGVEVTVMNCTLEGLLNPLEVEKAIRKNTQLIIMTHASNALGTVLPVEKVGQIARRHGIPFCVDTAQTAGAFPVNIPAMNADLLAFTGHKSLLGPQGTGGLYISEKFGDTLEPLLYGGTGSLSESDYQPDFLPDKYESGTPNTVGLTGLGAGAQFVLAQGIEVIQEHEGKLRRRLLEGLESIGGVIVYGGSDNQQYIPVLSFNISGQSPAEVATQMEVSHNILCRSGLQCAPVAHKTMGTFPGGTVRLSPGYFNTMDEVEQVLWSVSRIAKAA